MVRLVRGRTITDSWIASLEELLAYGREAYGLIVETEDPAPSSADPSVLKMLDEYLSNGGFQPIETVANTIFPEAMANSSLTRDQLYSRYRKITPMMHRHQKNKKGLYFERLIEYPLFYHGEQANQIESVVRNLEAELQRPNPLRFIYEMQVFAPGKDRRPIGFPCLSSLSFQLKKPQLLLSAMYRNQYYFERALGNFLGLARLHRYVAEQVGLEQGMLVVHAFHAELDHIGKKETERMISMSRTSS